MTAVTTVTIIASVIDDDDNDDDDDEDENDEDDDGDKPFWLKLFRLKVPDISKQGQCSRPSKKASLHF